MLTHIQGISISKKKGKIFSRKNLNSNSATLSWYFKKNHSIAFKRVVIDCEKMNGLVDSDETVIEKMLDTNQWCYHRKVLM